MFQRMFSYFGFKNGKEKDTCYYINHPNYIHEIDSSVIYHDIKILKFNSVNEAIASSPVKLIFNYFTDDDISSDLSQISEIVSRFGNVSVLIYTKPNIIFPFFNNRKIRIVHDYESVVKFINHIDISYDKFLGSIMGLIICDALGTTYEFRNKGTFNFNGMMSGGGVFGLKPGEFTDDSQMMLCILKSILENKTIDLKDIMNKFVDWRDSGYMIPSGSCFDIGCTINNAINLYEENGDDVYQGRNNNHSISNGAIMRLAPVPLFFIHNPYEGFKYCMETSEITHGTISSQASIILGEIIIRAVRGFNQKDLRKNLKIFEINQIDQKLKEITERDYHGLNHKTCSKVYPNGNILGEGSVYSTLETVFWALDNSDHFSEGIEKVINMGYDTDTTGAVYGQIAGALYGYESIPTEWRKIVASQKYLDTDTTWNDNIINWIHNLYSLSTIL